MGKKKKQDQTSDGVKVIALNKKARRDYEVVDTLEVGIVLNGAEVKSIRGGLVNLRESYVRVKGGECYLVGCNITPYAFARQEDISPTRDRKLLLHRKEIDRLHVQTTRKGLTIVPLKIYFNKRGRCKLELAVGRGKKLHDKRRDIKDRENKRQLDRITKN